MHILKKKESILKSLLIPFSEKLFLSHAPNIYSYLYIHITAFKFLHSSSTYHEIKKQAKYPYQNVHSGTLSNPFPHCQIQNNAKGEKLYDNRT